MSRLSVALALGLVLSYESAFCWGKVGHESVAEIAKFQLLPEVSAIADDLLGGSDFTDAATWPDKIKSDPMWKHISPYHYMGVSDDNEYFKQLASLKPSQQKRGDVLRALVKAEDILRSTTSSKQEKGWALRFMIHFVGDLHQPLHTGRPEDLGGNTISLKYFNQKTNLHSVWDSAIIAAILKPQTKRTLPDTIAYLTQLREPSAKEIVAWQDSYIMDWTLESLDLRLDAYHDWNGISKVYQKKFGPSVNERILRGGFRLAAWLNAIFTNKKFQPVKAMELRNNLARVLGQNYGNDIVLAPKSRNARRLNKFINSKFFTQRHTIIRF